MYYKISGEGNLVSEVFSNKLNIIYLSNYFTNLKFLIMKTDEISSKQLLAAATELNKVLELVDDDGNRIKTIPKDQKKLEKFIKDAASCIDGDEFTAATVDVLRAYGLWAEDDGADTAEDNTEAEETDVTIEAQIDDANTLKELTKIVMDNDEFKRIRKSVRAGEYKKVGAMKDAMFDELDKLEAEDKEEAPVEKAKAKKEPKPKKEKGESYTRIRAAAEVMKANPKLTLDAAIKKADELYSKKTGLGSNPAQSKKQCSKVFEVLTVFELI